jgi:putative DNA primase/helicase
VAYQAGCATRRQSTLIDVAGIPQELKERPQWVLWRVEERQGKLTKVPYAVRGGNARADDPGTWASFDAAVAAYGEKQMDGVGYVFSTDDPYCGVDLDDVLTDGVLHPAARQIVEELQTYGEISPSGNGVKLIVRGTKPGKRARTGKTPWASQFEIYDAGRYFTLTGNRVGSWSIREAQKALDAVYARMFPNDGIEGNDDLSERYAMLTRDDDTVLEAARKDGRFERLFRGDTTAYGSPSEADMAFTGMLARHTGDRDQLLRLWQASGLWREKSERRDYQDATMERALRDSGRNLAHLDKLNDLGNSYRLVAEHGSDLAHCEQLGWLTWDGTRWRGGGLGEATMRAKDSAIRFQKGVLAMNGSIDEKAWKRLMAHATASMSRASIVNAVLLAATEPAVSRALDQFDAAPHILNLRNGTLDLRTGELREHDRGDLLTLLAPTEYEPDAQSSDWDTFVFQVLPDAEVRQFVQRCAGYSLAGDPTEKALLFAHGPTDTGKSTFLNALEAALGEYCQTADFETFLNRRGGHGVRNDLARMRGARLVKSVEVERGERLAAGVIKALTGSDTIAARFLYQEHFEFRMQAVLWLAANDRPRVDADDDAMWRRIVHVPFEAVIPRGEQDRGLGDKLSTDEARQAVLAWMVAGYNDWAANGLGIPQKVLDYGEEYKEEMNPLRDWIDEQAIATEGAWTAYSDVRDSVVDFFDSRHIRPPSDKTIAAALRAAGFQDSKRYVERRQVRGWEGLEL